MQEKGMALRPLVFAGPSGAGKSTLIKMLMKEFPHSFGFSVSHTTRAPRAGEEDGVNYHFVNLDSFNKLKEQDGFIETAIYSGNNYGTSVKAVQDVVQQDKVRLFIAPRFAFPHFSNVLNTPFFFWQ